MQRVLKSHPIPVRITEFLAIDFLASLIVTVTL